MTTAKKIISIILAAALVIGSVAVTAFAETVVSDYAGSELTYWFDSDKTDDNGVTKLVPGDTITVTLSARTNYYWGNVGSEFVVWNNELAYTKGTIEFSDVCSSSFSPKEAAVTTASQFPAGTANTTHTLYKLSRQAQTDNLEAVAPNEDVLLYTWEFTLSEDAEIGSTVSVILPADKVTTATNSSVSKYPIYQSVNNSDTLSSTNIVSRFAETVNVDTLEIQVVDSYVTDEPVVEDTIVYEYAGSKLTYTFDSDRTEDGVTKLVPGDEITVTLSARTNYYWGNVGSEFVVWNNQLAYTKGTIEFSDVASTSFSPKEAAVTTASQFPAGTSNTTHTLYKLSRQAQTDNLEAVAPNQDVLLYTWTFTLAADAEVGSTVSVILPADKVTTETNSSVSKFPIYQSVNNGDTLSSTNIVSRFAETVVVDTLEIQVVSSYEGGTDPQPPVVEYADLTALKAAIAAAESADTTNCTDKSVAALEQALAAAKALNVEGTLKSEQDKINAAVETLNAAVAGLDKLDFSALNAQIARFEEADNTIYTDDSWADASDAYNVAKAISTADTQADINAAAADLKNALDNLVEYGKVNYTALNNAIAAYEAKLADKDNYTNWAGYEALYNAAKAIDQSVVYDKNGEQKAADDAAAALNGYALVEYDKVDYTALNDAIAAYNAKVADKDLYANWAEYEAAYNAAKAIDQSVVYNKNGEQKAADDAAAALNAVVLAYKDADYSAVEQAKNLAAALDPNAYTADSLKAVNDAVNAVVYDLDITKQAEVNAMADAINDAIGKLVPLGLCDYSGIDNALVAAQAYVTNKDNYTPDSWTASGIDAAYSAAFAIATGEKLIADEAGANQAKIDSAAKALTDACAELVLKADKSALEAAIARAGALVADPYTPDSWAAADLANVLAAANVVLADPNATADEVAAQVAAIEAAEAKLVVKADKGALADAIAAAKAKDEAAYTPDSWAEAALADAIAAAEAVYADDNATADAIAAQVAALAAATAKLVEKADKAALEAAINTEVVLENATEETLAAYREALAAAQDVLADENATADAVLAATNNLLAAIDGLDYYGACDYTAYNEAVAAANALVEDEYTTTSWAVADIATVLSENAVEEGLLDKDGNQDKIDAAAEVINAAIALLEKKADVSAILEALDADPKVAQQYATEDSWIAYEDARAAAEWFIMNSADIGESQADEIAAAAQALVDANAALVEKDADYTAVEEALAYVATKGELNQYTQASVKKLQAAIDAVVYGLGISKQAEVDAAADAIVKAADALEISQAAVTNVEMLGGEYLARETREYEITVSGAPSRVQFINEKGGTVTFDRKNRNVTVVSYDAQGNVVDYAEVEPAYEIWTVTASLGEGTYQAKAKIGSAWEAFTYEFEIEFVDKADDEIYFVAAPADGSAEAGKTLELKGSGAPAVITVVVPNTVVKVQLAFSIGCTTTYAATSSTATIVDNGDGTSTWTLARNFSNIGTYEMSLKLKDKAGWYDAVAEAINVTVTK